MVNQVFKMFAVLKEVNCTYDEPSLQEVCSTKKGEVVLMVNQVFKRFVVLKEVKL